jgi:5'-methylthioadenosine phosphorylase
MPEARLAVIGGSGLYKIEGLTDVEQVNMETPFGRPSDTITIGKLDGLSVAFLPRHGRHHTILPTEIPARANIYALKALGVEQIIAVNTVGSFREEIKPGDLVLPDQLIDRTTQRVNTFFAGSGVVVHVPFAEPFCPQLRQVLAEAAAGAGTAVHPEGTYLVMEGPAFSTRAESRLYRAWGCDIIGMTALPEARLAREAEICYAIIAGVTDYDAWQEAGAQFSVETIIQILGRNIETIKNIIRLAARNIPQARGCDCAHALKDAFATGRRFISPVQAKRLGPLLSGYLKERR